MTTGKIFFIFNWGLKQMEGYLNWTPAGAGQLNTVDGCEILLGTTVQNPWNDDSPANTNDQWFLMVLKRCWILSIESNASKPTTHHNSMVTYGKSGLPCIPFPHIDWHLEWVL